MWRVVLSVFEKKGEADLSYDIPGLSSRYYTQALFKKEIEKKYRISNSSRIFSTSQPLQYNKHQHLLPYNTNSTSYLMLKYKIRKLPKVIAPSPLSQHSRLSHAKTPFQAIVVCCR